MISLAFLQYLIVQHFIPFGIITNITNHRHNHHCFYHYICYYNYCYYNSNPRMHVNLFYSYTSISLSTHSSTTCVACKVCQISSVNINTSSSLSSQQEVNGPCYLLKEEAKNFQDAEDYCVTLGGHLASSLSQSIWSSVIGFRLVDFLCVIIGTFLRVSRMI